MSKIIVTRKEVHDKIVENISETVEAKKKIVLSYLVNKLKCEDNTNAINALDSYLKKSFFSKYFNFWKECNRNRSYMETKHAEWLRNELNFPDEVVANKEETSANAETCGLDVVTEQAEDEDEDGCEVQVSSRKGRPKKDFKDASDTTKNRMAAELCKKNDSAKLALATVMSLREEGKIAAAKLLKESTSSTPSRADRILKKWESEEKKQRMLTPEEAASLMLRMNLTTDAYKIMRKTAKEAGHDIYPSYDAVLAAKKKNVS